MIAGGFMSTSNQNLKTDTPSKVATVILVVGPGGAGKTSLGKRIGQESRWHHIAEDAIWDELPRDPHAPRTDAEKAAVQRRVVDVIRDHVAQGKNVVLDFILYEIPPQPITYYQTELSKLGIHVVTWVLCPSVERILERQASRANSHDTEVAVAERRKNAEHQVSCARSEHIDSRWIIDSSDISAEELYEMYFLPLAD
jgi:predicted kinase